MKKLLLVSIAACFLLSCNSKKKEETTSTPSEIKDVESTESVLGKVIVYEGLLPCVNCDGIETTLKIYQSDDTTRTHTFELTSIYKSKGPERKFVEKGSYNIEKGVGNDRERTIYVLDFDQLGSSQTFYGFYAGNPDKIFLLNNKREKIKSKSDYALTLNE